MVQSLSHDDTVGDHRDPLAPLFVSHVVHKAVVEVDESGTTAAAATANVLTMALGFPPPPPVPVFRADQPFLFVIRDRVSGAVLFHGRAVDPEESPST